MDPARAPIDVLQEELGRALEAAIDKQGGKVAFAARAGLNRATLYRLLRGGNVSTDILLRTLRALGRIDLIAALLAAPQPSPLELRPAGKNEGSRRTRRHAQPAGKPRSSSLVSQLSLGRLPDQPDHG